jgi:hypothetical protein
LVLAVSVSSTESAASHLQLTLAELRSGYQVDRVVNLLEALYAVQNDHLQSLIDNWATTQPALQDAVDTANQLASTQNGQCQIISSTLTFSNNQINLYQSYIQAAQDSIARNEASLQEKEQNRCAGNLIFINRLKDNQDTLALLQYLRGKVADPSFKNYIASSSGAFFELKSVNKANMFSFLAKHQMKMLIQQYQGEDDLGYNAAAREDVGTGHLDNDKGALGLDKYMPGQVGDVDLFISQLVDLLDGLIAQIHHDNDNLRDAELESVEAFIEYKSQLARENAVLQKFIQQWGGHISDLQTTYEQNQAASDACVEKAGDLTEAAQEKQDQLDQSAANFAATKSSLDGTLSLLEEVIDVYVNKVASASEIYKEKVDTWLSDHHYQAPA